MSLKAPVFFAALISCTALACAQDKAPVVHEACAAQMDMSEKSIQAALVRHLGEWQDCKVETYDEEDFGLNASILFTWEGVQLRKRVSPPETTIYTVQVTGDYSLPSQWYEKSRENFVDEAFDMNWEFDVFPGPRSEHYQSPENGTNAQFWAERDKDGNVTWMRFSYAL